MLPGSRRSPDVGSSVPERSGSTPGNLHRWSQASTVRSYQELGGWIDAGERTVLMSLADEVRGEPILDLGVGGGRTTDFFRLLTTTDRYVGVDWSSAMVAACRE